jgi:undecaprenyl-diphosphatase
VHALDWLSIGLSRIGTVGAVWIAIALVLAILRRRPWLLVRVAVAVGVADLLADAIKFAVPRHRPFEPQLGPHERTHSFPSGHTATAFAGATMLASYAPRLRVPLYVLAVLIGLSRLYNGVHYPTDVIAGAVLGLLVATALLWLGGARLRSRRGLRSG